MGSDVGGGFRIGNMCTPVVDSSTVAAAGAAAVLDVVVRN